jgi:hypothetical protein
LFGSLGLRIFLVNRCVEAQPYGLVCQEVHKGFVWSSNADIVTALRFGTTGDLLFAIQAKGVVGMNLVGCNIEGGVDEPLYGYLSGTGTMKGTVLLEEV